MHECFQGDVSVTLKTDRGREKKSHKNSTVIILSHSVLCYVVYSRLDSSLTSIFFIGQ